MGEYLNLKLLVVEDKDDKVHIVYTKVNFDVVSAILSDCWLLLLSGSIATITTALIYPAAASLIRADLILNAVVKFNFRSTVYLNEDNSQIGKANYSLIPQNLKGLFIYKLNQCDVECFKIRSVN